MATVPTEVARASRAAVWRRTATTPWSAALLLLVAYLGLSLLNDPMGSLGTDTGGKVATLEVMADRPLSLDPDVGYWADQLDPDGAYHGLWYTEPIGGRYVNVTTLPMLELAALLHRVGGLQLALLLPMLGATAAAFAARRLVRLLDGDEHQGWVAFWLVGLASPMTLYALDLWEHSLGVALVAWGVAALLRVESLETAWRFGALAGLAFGAAFSMRSEALVYGFVAVAVVCVTSLVLRRAPEAIVTGVAAALGVAAAAVANLLLEHAVLGEGFRAGRASGTAGGGGADMVVRAKEAMVTAAGLLPSMDGRDIALGVVLAGGLVVAARASTDPGHRRLAVLAGALAIGLYLSRVLEGPGFVPGMIAATPFAALGLAFVPVGRKARQIAAIAVVSLPLVWYFQYTGGAVPQWAGRYILPSGLLLLVLGAVASDRVPRLAVRGFVAASIGVTAFGLVWMSQRTHEIGRAARDVAAFPEPVVISSESFFLRELGAAYEGAGSRWLSARDGDDGAGAVAIVRQGGAERFAYLTRTSGRPPDPAGFDAVAERSYDWLDIEWRVITYARS